MSDYDILEKDSENKKLKHEIDSIKRKNVVKLKDNKYKKIMNTKKSETKKDTTITPIVIEKVPDNILKSLDTLR